MAIIVNSLSEIPNNISREYHEKGPRVDIEKGKHLKITFEKNLGVIHRLFVGALACLSLAFIAIASIFSFNFPSIPDKVSLWWQQAMNGVDKKVVLIKKDVEKT